MSIYGNLIIKESVDSDSINESELSNYLENYFLESVLNESGCARINYVQEIVGNANKNNNFIQVLDQIDGLMTMFIDKIKLVDEYLYWMSDQLDKTNEKTFNKVFSDCKTRGRETNKKLDKIKDDFKKKYGKDGKDIWPDFKRQIKMFNNKYTETSMENKKKLDTKLESYFKLLKEVLDRYQDEGEYDKKAYNTYKKIDNFNVTYSNAYSDFEQAWYKYIWNEAKYTINDLLFVVDELNIKKLEKSPLFKFLNKEYVRSGKLK